MEELIPHRIRMARQAQGLSMDELVKKMGGTISKMSISKIERGVFQPSQDILLSIAQACKVPMSYFYRQDYIVESFAYRIKNVSSIHAKQIEAHLIKSIEKYLDNEFSLKINRTPFINPLADDVIQGYDDVERATKKLRKIWYIGSQPIHSVYELLQEHGVMIIELPIDCAGLAGTSTMVNNDIPVIIVTFPNGWSKHIIFALLGNLKFNIR